MTVDELVLTADRGAVRVLTMNRPAARNALSRRLIRSLYAAPKSADGDASVRAVVLTGTDPAFCAGVDLKEAARDGLLDAIRAERIGLVTEVVAHDRLLDRAIELAGQTAEVPGPTMLGLEEIYVRGASAVVDPALAAEDAIAGAQEPDLAGLEQRRFDVMRSNKSQIMLDHPTNKDVPMPTFPALTHVALTVRDLSVSAPWYRKLIGIDPVIDEDTDAGFRHVVYALPGDTLFGIHQHAQSAPDETFSEFRVGLDHVAFACGSRAELESWGSASTNWASPMAESSTHHTARA